MEATTAVNAKLLTGKVVVDQNIDRNGKPMMRRIKMYCDCGNRCQEGYSLCPNCRGIRYFDTGLLSDPDAESPFMSPKDYRESHPGGVLNSDCACH